MTQFCYKCENYILENRDSISKYFWVLHDGVRNFLDPIYVYEDELKLRYTAVNNDDTEDESSDSD